MKLKLNRQYRDNDVDELKEIKLARHDDYREHSHILNYIDFVKINDEVKSVVVDEIFKEYALFVINRLLKRIK